MMKNSERQLIFKLNRKIPDITSYSELLNIQFVVKLSSTNIGVRVLSIVITKRSFIQCLSFIVSFFVFMLQLKQLSLKKVNFGYSEKINIIANESSSISYYLL
ncbi:uncharacterized protein LOC111632650 [Centruroides sculpturatus]|uniref:uncharacterized protein LOC111632650 n=1 Tax=Centruroides sculpturatus TaxID=218467 RepID=UPI000C6ED4FD|nr:uncharacterized protein LOC111632650 [Centruroides sculpturatus]